MKRKKAIAFITSRFPFDGKELFFYAEFLRLCDSFDATVVPIASGMKDCWYPDLLGRTAPVSPPFSATTFIAAVQEFARRPAKALRLLWDVLSMPRSASARIRNLLIFPKALAVARFVRENGFDHVHAYWLSTPSTVAYVASQLAGVDWSATGHRWDIVDSNIRGGNTASASFVRSARFIRTISEKGGQLVTQALSERDRSRVHVIHLGVELPERPADPPASDADGSLRLACIATLTPVKGHATLLEALRKLKQSGVQFQCTLIGSGPLRETIERSIAEYGLGAVVDMLPQMPQSELMKKVYGGDFDAVVLTSVDRGNDACEGIPVSLIEAMAAGLPVVATRSGSVPELVDASNGFLVDVEDAHGVAAAIAFLAADRDLRRRLGDAARKKIESQFAIDKTMAEFAALLDVDVKVPRTEEARLVRVQAR